MDISIIIPTYNEAAHIGRLIRYLRSHTDVPILVVNSPQTTDSTAEKASRAGAKVVECPQAGRAPQMNYGARQTESEVLYFIHADTLPPCSFTEDISQALARGRELGYFSYRFDSKDPLLRVNSYCTRFDGLFAGGGDQTLFIRRTAFEQLGGFREDLHLMEDFDLIKRAKAVGLCHELIQKDALVSARKYANNSWLRVNLVNLWVFFLFHCGVSTDRLCGMYRRMLRT